MSNVLLWFPRIALDDCIIDGKFSFEFSFIFLILFIGNLFFQ